MPHRSPDSASAAARPRLRAALVAAAAACALGAPVLAQAKGSERPGYKFLRADEDWSDFRPGQAAERDFFDALKYVPLGQDSWVSFGGRLEARLEGWDDFAFGARPPGFDDDDRFTVSRAFLHADLHVGDFRLFLEGKTAQATDRDLPGGRRAIDMDTLEAQQLFAEMPFRLSNGQRLRVRFGRQMFSFGKQRVISPLPWANVLRHWDGVVADHYAGDWHTTALFTAFAPVDKTDFNERDDGQLLFGLYARRVPEEGWKTEYYWLGTTQDVDAFNGTAGSSKRHTFGTRLWNSLGGGFDFEAEGAYQAGRLGGAEVHAGFATAELGLRPSGGLWNHRWALGLDWASGDNRAGGDVGTYDQLFPLGHAYLGFQDFIGRQNVLAARLGVSAKPTPKLTVSVTAHAFYLEDRDDALYNAGGGVLRAPPAGSGTFTSSEVGQELDLLARYRFDRHLTSYAGYSHFWPGGAVQGSGPALDSDFAYVGVAYTF